jgi:predicted XRE-type DNA-binding protein
MTTRSKKVKPFVARNPRELAKLLGLPPAVAAEWELHGSLCDKIASAAGKSGLTHAKIARLAGTSRSRLTAIINGRTSDVSTDLLFRVLWALGYEAKLTFKRTRAA